MDEKLPAVRRFAHFSEGRWHLEEILEDGERVKINPDGTSLLAIKASAPKCEDAPYQIDAIFSEDSDQPM